MTEQTPDRGSPALDPDAITYALFELARHGTISPNQARALAGIGFIEPDLVDVWLLGRERLRFEFAAWTEMGRAAAGWAHRILAGEERPSETARVALEAADEAPTDLWRRVTLRERVLCCGFDSRMVRRAHTQVAYDWYGADTAHLPVEDVALTDGLTVQEASTIESGSFVQISERRIRQHAARMARPDSAR